MEAYLEGDLLNKSILVHRRTTGEYLHNNKYRQESVVERIHVPIVEPLFAELQHFIESILEQKTPRVTARDGYNALRLAHDIRMAVQQRLVDVNTISKPKTTGYSFVTPNLTSVQT
jgi:predicted dehydrogenase